MTIDRLPSSRFRRQILKSALASAALALAARGTIALAQSAVDSGQRHRMLAVNGIQMHVVEQGAGPLVILCHGWPELWYSWRRQIPALAEAGYRVAAPDLRGFGQTDAPADIAAYNIMDTVGDVVGLVQALGERRAVIVGHNWGAVLAWSAALIRPDMFNAVVAMSVPFRARGGGDRLQALRATGRTNFYQLYFQTPGVAETELERDPASTVRRVFASGNASDIGFNPPGGGFLDKRPDPGAGHLPPWLNEADVDYFATEYRRTGYRGGLNWYRNIDRNWELLAPWDGATIRQPALFIAGAQDPLINAPVTKAEVEHLSTTVPGLLRTVLIDGGGHWIQQERAAEVNVALLDFLKTI